MSNWYQQKARREAEGATVTHIKNVYRRMNRRITLLASGGVFCLLCFFGALLCYGLSADAIGKFLGSISVCTAATVISGMILCGLYNVHLIRLYSPVVAASDGKDTLSLLLVELSFASGIHEEAYRQRVGQLLRHITSQDQEAFDQKCQDDLFYRLNKHLNWQFFEDKKGVDKNETELMTCVLMALTQVGTSKTARNLKELMSSRKRWKHDPLLIMIEETIAAIEARVQREISLEMLLRPSSGFTTSSSVLLRSVSRSEQITAEEIAQLLRPIQEQDKAVFTKPSDLPFAQHSALQETEQLLRVGHEQNSSQST